jgi:succinate dehydrogenase / fumarate reductase iron-sulfur subunit
MNLEVLSNAYRLFRCRTIMNGTEVSTKGLNTAAAISLIRNLLMRRAL